ncbi:MAG: hypothetical protein JWQ07_5775 [Ramlibacter sp.]|nr:hypothetical protein [Ramlibacter sp.]
MAITSPEDIRQLLAILDRDVESWKADHEGAMRCRKAEAKAALAVGVFLAIDVIDMSRRAAVFSGRQAFDPTEDAIIESLYREWLESANKVSAVIDAAESDGFEVDYIESFRRAHREARAMFVPDSQFFAGQALTDIRDRAVDDHRGGLTADFHEFSRIGTSALASFASYPSSSLARFANWPMGRLPYSFATPITPCWVAIAWKTRSGVGIELGRGRCGSRRSTGPCT